MTHRYFLLLAGLMALLPSFSEAPRTEPPPCTVRINDTLFADRTEVANVYWREYEFWVYRNAREQHAAMLPDSARFAGLPRAAEYDLVNAYYRHPGFNNYPAVGISHAQAEAFCGWRSDRVNELLASGKAPKGWKFRKVTYRLPTEAEWELAAAGKLAKEAYPFGFRNLLDPRKGPAVHAVFAGKPPDFLAPIESYKPNGSGLYQCCGNVAEMVAEPGIAKGGHFGLPVDRCTIRGRTAYTGAEPWLGFRCVAVVTY